MANLFETAKKTTTRKAKVETVVSRPDLKSTLLKMIEVNEKLAAYESLKAELDETIREAGKFEMIKLYNKTKKFPGTIKITTNDAEFQFITSDRYKKIDEDRFDELSEKYGSDIVESETKYSFNTEVLLKNMDVINELLSNSDKISDDDKANLLEATTSYTVKKGTISNLTSIGGSIEDIIDDIQPVFSVKGVKSI